MKAKILLPLALACVVFFLPANLMCQMWQIETIRSNISGAWTRSADFDSDGDPDILVQSGDSVLWYENQCPGWTEHLIDPTFYNSKFDYVDVLDLDGDGDTDVLKFPASDFADPLTWNENKANGTEWELHEILPDVSANWMQSSWGDLDGDGDTDLVVPELDFVNSPPQSSIYWLENTGDGDAWSKHPLKIGIYMYSSVADLDGDGDPDIACFETSDGILWLENQLPDTAWVQHPVVNNGDFHLLGGCADLNGDGAADIASSMANGGLAYYANPGWEEVIIHNSPQINIGIVGDVDSDGDLDFPYGGWGNLPQPLGWAENQNDGADWVLHDIYTHSPATIQMIPTGVADIDGDGDADIVSLTFSFDTGLGSAFWAANPLIDANAAKIRLHSVTTTRQTGGDHGYTLDGIRMKNYARAKLENPANFGGGGIYPKAVTITDDYGTEGSLAAITGSDNIDLFYFGAFNRLDPTYIAFTEAEIDSLYAWSKRGGKLIIGGSSSVLPFYDPSALNDKWGFGVEFHPPTVQILPASNGAGAAIFDGPFGNLPAASEGGSAQGYFNTLPEAVVVLGEDANGNITLILDCATLDLIIADGDTYTDLGGVSAGPEIQNDNDRFWLNTIAYMDQLQSPPVVLQDGNTLSVGDYLGYQWLLDGQPIDGATDSVYTPAVSGNYSVLVSMSCGCEATSEEVFVSINGVENPHSEFEMSASPNPASDWVTLNLSSQRGQPFQVEILDVNGRLVKAFEMHGTTASVSVAGLSAGSYVVKVFNEKGMAVRRLTKL